MFELVYSGFDKLDVAFQGGLPERTLATLKVAKEQAQKENEAQFVVIGPGNVEAYVHERGLKGGYTFRVDTGPTGANFFFKENSNFNEWNIFVTSKSFGFLAYGLEEYRDRILQTLVGLGAIIRKESLNRIDFAMDFKTTGFELNPYQFVAPPKSRLRINPSEKGDECDWEGRPDEYRPAVIMTGRRVETVTIGKMPGRQICVYDKRVEAIQKRKPQWFEVWGLDPKDRSQQAWRVELRVGKHYLSQVYGLKTFQDLDDSIGDVFGKLARDVRYLEDKQADTNVTRAVVHPLWLATNAALETKLSDRFSGLLPGRILEIERERQKDMFRQNIMGNTLSLAALDGLDDDTARFELENIASSAVKERMDDQSFKLERQMEKRRNRYSCNSR